MPQTAQENEASVGASTILVVDDEVAIAQLLSERLLAAGYQTRMAHDGFQGLLAVEQGGVDLVILDIMMPKLDGYQALERLRQKHSFADLPVIILSAKDQGEDVIRALHLGANDYAIKPFDFKVLLKRIDVHLALKAPQEHILGGYRIDRRIGEGGMGVVYSAYSLETAETVALKALPRSLTIDETFVQRFVQEAQLAARVEHPHVVRLLEAGRDGETHFIIMELVEGTDLADLWEQRAVGIIEALQIARQTALGLEALNAAGVLHRDIKPENIVISRQGIAKVTDLGIARDLKSRKRLTDSGVGIGSIGYASPEQIDGQGDFTADVYSLGCTLFFALSGRDPFPQDASLSWLMRRKKRKPPRVDAYVEGLAPAVVELVQKMMEPEPKDRFASYRDLVTAIDRAMNAPVNGLRLPAWLWPWGALVASVLFGAGLVYLLFSYG